MEERLPDWSYAVLVPLCFHRRGVNAGLQGAPLVILATIMTAIYLVVAPNLMKPLVKEVTGDDSFTIGHPTTTLSVISGYLGKLIGNKEKSTEDIKFPKGLGFLREVSITGSIVIALTYIVMSFILRAMGKFLVRFGVTLLVILARLLTFSPNRSSLELASLSCFWGVRMLIAEIVPAFKGIADKVVPGAIPALDCPVLFNYAPNA
jgi:PTS system ascorbate-specific IIC component